MNRKFSIAYVIESLGSGGAERQIVGLIRHLDRQRFKAQVLTYFPENFFKKDLDEVGVRVVSFERCSRFDLRPVLYAAYWLNSGKVDLVHSYLYTANFYSVLAHEIARTGKVIVSERCNMLREKGLVRLYGPWSFRRADLTIANSEDARRDLIQNLGIDETRVIFVPNGIDHDKFHPAEPQERALLRRKLGWAGPRRVFLTVASFKEQKNHMGFLDALAGIDSRWHIARFCWAGVQIPRDNFLRVQARINQMGLTSVIDLMGERNDVADLYRASDVLVLPSLWEGTANVVLEALACGCPVITTDTSDVKRYVLPGVTGWLIPPGKPEILRQALMEAADTPLTRLRRMGQEGWRQIKSLSMDFSSLAHRHEEIYSTLLQDGNAFESNIGRDSR